MQFRELQRKKNKTQELQWPQLTLKNVQGADFAHLNAQQAQYQKKTAKPYLMAQNVSAAANARLYADLRLLKYLELTNKK